MTTFLVSSKTQFLLIFYLMLYRSLSGLSFQFQLYSLHFSFQQSTVHRILHLQPTHDLDNDLTTMVNTGSRKSFHHHPVTSDHVPRPATAVIAAYQGRRAIHFLMWSRGVATVFLVCGFAFVGVACLGKRAIQCFGADLPSCDGMRTVLQSVGKIKKDHHHHQRLEEAGGAFEMKA